MSGRCQLMTVILAMILAMGVFVSGFRRISHFRPGPARLMWSLRFGSGPSSVGKDRGLDGKEYGPLAFSVSQSQRHPVLWIADTYHFRVLRISGHQSTSVDVPQSFLEDLCLADQQKVFLANNQGARVLRVRAGHASVAIHLGEPLPGYTKSIWSLTADGGSSLWVEWVRIGRGSIYSEVDRYPLIGGDTRERVLKQKTLGWMAVSPQNNQLYIQPLWDQQGPLVVHVYASDGIFRRTLHLPMPSSSGTAQLLGVDALGNLYVDLHGQNLIRVFRPNGRIKASIHIPASPIQSWIPGYVEPDGTLYVMDSTAQRFRVLRYRWHETRIWSWRLP